VCERSDGNSLDLALLRRRTLFLLVAEKLAGLPVDKMQPGASWASDCLVVLAISGRSVVIQRVLDFFFEDGTTEYERHRHAQNCGADSMIV
jgi:hypothetical protein